MKAIPQLHEDFAWIYVMRPPKRQAVVQQHSAIRNVYPANTYRQPFAEIPANRDIKRRVPRQMRRTRRIPILKPRSVIHVRRSVAAPRQSKVAPDVQSIPLVMIQQKITGIRGGSKIRESAVDRSSPLYNLVRIRHVQLTAFGDPRRMQCQFPSSN